MKLILISIGIIFFITYTLPLIWAKINIGNIFGIALGILLVITGASFDLIMQLCKNPAIRILLIFALTVFIIFLVSFIITLIKIIVHCSGNATCEKVIIILGCRVKGKVPTRALVSRCSAGYEHLIKNKDSIAILSGGQGADEEISEAQCMKSVLISMGIDESRLIIEDKSTSTRENLEFSKRIIQSLGYTGKIAIATNEYHLYRATLIARQCGLNVSRLSGRSIRFLRIPAFTREVFGIWQLKLKKMIKRR